jgi:hypothetical protein
MANGDAAVVRETAAWTRVRSPRAKAPLLTHRSGRHGLDLELAQSNYSNCNHVEPRSHEPPARESVEWERAAGNKTA